MQGLLSPSRVHFTTNKGSLFLRFSLFISRPMHTSFSHVPPYCRACHLLISPLPRVRSRVLTLGFVQICSLRGWKVVMRAKKNSLALSLTTRLVFQMKPNENSILYPCYSLAPILRPLLRVSLLVQLLRL